MTPFWQTLPRPIIGLSPMDGVTDHPFRHIQKRYGNPDLLVTEFVRVEQLCAGEVKLLRMLLYDESQRPIVAQVYGTTPDVFRATAVLLCRLGFDGIDINMGCPSSSVAENGAGAGWRGCWDGWVITFLDKTTGQQVGCTTRLARCFIQLFLTGWLTALHRSVQPRSYFRG